MLKRDSSNDEQKQSEKFFRVGLVPINQHITTDELLSKLRLMAGGCGLRMISAKRIDDLASDKEKEH